MDHPKGSWAYPKGMSLLPMPCWPTARILRALLPLVRHEGQQPRRGKILLASFNGTIERKISERHKHTPLGKTLSMFTELYGLLYRFRMFQEAVL